VFIAIRMETRHQGLIFVDDKDGFYEGINRSVAAGAFAGIILGIPPATDFFYSINVVFEVKGVNWIYKV